MLSLAQKQQIISGDGYDTLRAVIGEDGFKSLVLSSTLSTPAYFEHFYGEYGVLTPYLEALCEATPVRPGGRAAVLRAVLSYPDATFFTQLINLKYTQARYDHIVRGVPLKAQIGAVLRARREVGLSIDVLRNAELRDALKHMHALLHNVPTEIATYDEDFLEAYPEQLVKIRGVYKIIEPDAPDGDGVHFFHFRHVGVLQRQIEAAAGNAYSPMHQPSAAVVDEVKHELRRVAVLANAPHVMRRLNRWVDGLLQSYLDKRSDAKQTSRDTIVKVQHQLRQVLLCDAPDIDLATKVSAMRHIVESSLAELELGRNGMKRFLNRYTFLVSDNKRQQTCGVLLTQLDFVLRRDLGCDVDAMDHQASYERYRGQAAIKLQASFRGRLVRKRSRSVDHSGGAAAGESKSLGAAAHGTVASASVGSESLSGAAILATHSAVASVGSSAPVSVEAVDVEMGGVEQQRLLAVTS